MSIVDRIRALPPAAQMGSAALTAVVIAAVLATSWLAMRPRYEVLFRDLRPADAATIVAQLDKDKIPYKLEDGGAVILAPASRIDQTRLAIMGADLPLKGTVGFELFNKSDMGLTEFAQRINYQRALQGELSRTIMTIEAIDTARVHLTLPEPSIFRADRKPAKASVTLTTRPGRRLTPEAVAGIQRLVGASVPDLDVGNVVVLDAQGALVAGAAPAVSEDPSSSAAVQQTRAVEEYYIAALRRTLEPLYPNVRVNVLLPADQWGAGFAADPAREEALSNWDPNNRAFRIQVEVSAPAAFTDGQRDDVARMVAEATGWSADRGDTLLFPSWIAPEETADVAAVAATPPESVSSVVTPSLTPRTDLSLVLWLVGGIAALAAFALWLARRGRVPAQLTSEQRDAYVRRLRRLLAEDSGHAG